MTKTKKTPDFSKGVQTLFATRVYRVVSQIPAGQTLSYGEVARRAGNPGAARAVGTILSKNRNDNVPCHRVIRADGGMGGYAFGGVKKKQEILRRERLR